MTDTVPPPAHPPAPLRSSPFARASLVAYLFLIVYASWYPFSGWQNNNLAALTDVIRQWPRYWTWFDVLTNIVGYVPLGMLLVFVLYPWCRRWLAIALSTLIGVLISGTMETVQYFLPSRVTSLLDFLTNSTGGLIGAILGVLLTPLILEKGRLRLLRKQWLSKEASREMVILGLWPLAQIYPQAYLFGHGQLLPILSDWLGDLFDTSVDLAAILRNGIELSAEEYWLSETIITACGCTGAILMCLFILDKNAPKARVAALLLLAALSVKAMASALFFKPEYAFSWLTPGAQGGLLIASIMLYGFSYAPTHVQRRLSVLMLLISLLFVNLVPSNPYFIVTLQTWVQGKFLNFNGAAQFLSLLWPFFALWALLRNPANRQAAKPP
ncbi:VanZ family protein [Undibacterium sp.]|jgi:VanZ family protein|uniref:VanZ family protein n=1 Tax=Undibacterium sp. TaxID=1914977 RepID=UPI002C5DEE35|nr:VanZ family protein [Undibacterium sp.]HTD05985.1 VanZ family protein [Undibacterium sp.]